MARTMHANDPIGRRRPPNYYRWPLFAALLLCGVLTWRLSRPGGGGFRELDATPRKVALRGDLSPEEQRTIRVFKEVAPSVVYITSIVERRSPFSWNAIEVPRGTGSGFVWDKKGLIVTNRHVVAESNSWRVRLAGQNTSYQARLVGVYDTIDLAVLQINAPEGLLHPIPVGRSSDLQVGQKVIAIGNPFGLDRTLTTGVISALDRSVEIEGRRYDDLIQTDAAINHGNSGGPLLDSSGRLIGINAAIVSPSGASAGIGFAIPVDVVNEVVPAIIANRTALRPGLGIYALTEEQQAQLGIDAKGVVVRSFPSRSAAKDAGMRGTVLDRDGRLVLGDVIVAIGDDPVRDFDDLKRAIAKRKVGEKVLVTCLRDKRELEIPVELQALPLR